MAFFFSHHPDFFLEAVKQGRKIDTLRKNGLRIGIDYWYEKR